MSYSNNRKKHLCSYASNSDTLKEVMGGTHQGNPKENNSLKKEFQEFEHFIIKKSNVFSWPWEELTEGLKESVLFKKSFSE